MSMFELPMVNYIAYLDNVEPNLPEYIESADRNLFISFRSLVKSTITQEDITIIRDMIDTSTIIAKNLLISRNLLKSSQLADYLELRQLLIGAIEVNLVSLRSRGRKKMEDIISLDIPSYEGDSISIYLN